MQKLQFFNEKMSKNVKKCQKSWKVWKLYYDKPLEIDIHGPACIFSEILPKMTKFV